MHIRSLEIDEAFRFCFSPTTRPEVSQIARRQDSPMPTAGSPSFSSATSTSIAVDLTDNSSSNPGGSAGGAAGSNAMQSWWESISKARSRILELVSLLHLPDLAALADSDRPARSLLDSPVAYAALSAALSSPSSGSGDDPLCQWLYDTFQSSDPDLRLVALSFVPLLAGLYLSRVVSSSSSNSPSLSGFEAVLLALYATEVKARGGKPLLVSSPDLSVHSLYHTPRPSGLQSTSVQPKPPPVGVLSPPLEPQIAVKSTKRACIVAVALDSFYKIISSMPSRSKIDFCEFVAGWAGQDCPCRFELDDGDLKPPLSCSSSLSSSSSSQIRILAEGDGEIGGAVDYMRRLNIQDSHNSNREEEEDNIHSRGSRVPLPWELLQPVLRILGHCLLAPLNSQEVRDAASVAVRCVYARASHDLLAQAILASRSLIQLDNTARKVGKPETSQGNSSKPNTPSKPKKPEVFLLDYRRDDFEVDCKKISKEKKGVISYFSGDVNPVEDLAVAPVGGARVYIVTVTWHKGLNTKHSAIETLTSVLGSEEAAQKALVYVYDYVFPGFAAKLTPSEAFKLEKQPGILQVIPDTTYHLMWMY
ncbi:hypothetical protein ZIOFF_063077 [Zingiber officinale]|uniref:Inhibitor I9 domain-containing protein n=1 Tax=Zingiber officinale TaxID=94328 RepID=A0A8J5KFX2_ZINOF|nr:hypothetical protein ZIOFF_063077 [Zingiber officinale]